MPTDDVLIPDPVLDDRLEADRIAARIHRSIGNLTIDDAQLIIDFGEALRSMIADAGAVSEPLLPELSSARPAEAHVVLLTEIERTFTETLFRLNQIPNKVRVALLRLMGITLRPAVASTTTLQFTKTDAFLNIDVTIPAGTEVATDDRKVRVTTDIELVIAIGAPSATVAATATQEGDIGRLPPNTIGLLLQSVAGIAIVANTTALTGGADAETPDQGKVRARQEFDIGEHLGSSLDWENWIYFEVLRRHGRVTAFEQYLSDFSAATLGYLLIVIQGSDGLAPTQALIDSVAAVINQRHVAGISVAVRGPSFKSFNISASVKVEHGVNAATLINKAKSNLAAFYDPLRFPYGPLETDRFLSVSDIVGQIEAASPRLISVLRASGGFAVTITIDGLEYQEDIPLAIGEIPALLNVTLTTP
jgi:uncharacterized phage protein gp47/JayE